MSGEMLVLIVAIVLTLGVSAFCSLLEAFILSTTVPEVESLKRRHPHLGALLERFKATMDETSSAILTLNTIANTLGSVLVGVLAGRQFDNDWRVGLVTGLLVLGILIFSEIIPKNVGVIYRRSLQAPLVYPIRMVRWAMYPLSWVAKRIVRVLIPLPRPSTPEAETEELRLLTAKQAKDGTLTASERDLILNALSLEDTDVEDIMTPRTVVTALDGERTVGDIFTELRNIPFARLPVYREEIDHIIGVVRRRDLLTAWAEDRDHQKVSELMGEALFVPETASAASALQLFRQKHQQLAVVVDEYGSTAGVVTMEDIIEHLLGWEIYEDTDVAVDMRELARSRARKVRTRGPAPRR